MDHWGTGTDSESLLPDFPVSHEQTSQNHQIHLEMRPPCPSRTGNMDDNALDVEIKEEVGELFMGRSIDEGNNQTIFPSGLILIHDQPTMTVTTPEGRPRTETHLLTYTPVYMTENQTPSYIQTSSPSSSIIRTNNSQVQFPRHAIQQISSEGTRFSPRLRPPPKDPLEISPSEANYEVQSNPPSKVTIKNHFVCTLCGIIFNTFAERNEHVLGSHEHSLCTPHTPEKNRNLTNLASPSCHVNISIPTNQHLIQVHEEKVVSSHAAAGSNVKMNKCFRLREERRRKKLGVDLERKKKHLGNETPGQKTKRLRADAECHRKRLGNETEEKRHGRLSRDAERQRNHLANETLLEQRMKRLAANAARKRQLLANETPEEKTTRLTDSFQCEFCEKSFVSKKNLRGHMIRGHSKAEDKKFKCDHCEKTFAIQRDCKIHTLTHSKSFICDKCGKGFKDKKGLTNHTIFKHRFDPDIQEKYWKV